MESDAEGWFVRTCVGKEDSFREGWLDAKVDGTALNISSVRNPISVGFVEGKEVAGSVAMISSLRNPISVGLLVLVSDGVIV